ncbi:MAG: 2-oxo acid dehydrogenase subunit E2 [Spirochaetaceae bacterium]|jgi:pyruvate dehydrogenase E2 component (dihydrolipoamide acetyltransferase)|nr:2-oxo acid dehydrogenase subunit E2 [Spirochaetaceae bacterium]
MAGSEIRIKNRAKLKSTRRFIGQRMSESLRTMPQDTAVFDLESGALMALKDELKTKNKNVTVSSIITRIMATILRDYPLLNSAVAGEEVITYESCNVALGIGLETGIMTVVIREAQDKDVFAISDELREKTDLIKVGRLPLDEMKGSTFTVSSIGVLGIRYSTVVLNPPESAMLGIGVTEKRVVVQPDNSTAIRQVTSFSLTHNHTLLDGYHVGIVIRLLRERLENPRAWMGL